MSKVIMLAEAAEGHINPCLPIIEKLVERGHQIVCITGRQFKRRVEKKGADFYPLPKQWDPEEKEAYSFFPELQRLKGLAQIKYYLKHVMFDQVPDTTACLNDVLKYFPADVIISDTFMLAGNWITEAGGPPNIRLSVLPLSLPGKDLAPFGLGLLPGTTFLSKLRNNALRLLFEKFLFKDVQHHANKIRLSMGLPTFKKSFFVEGYKIPNLVLHTSTPAFEYNRNAYPSNFRFIGPVNAQPDNQFTPPSWWHELKQDKPVILVTQGTIAKNIDDLIAPTIEALKDEDLLVIGIPVNQNDLQQMPENTYTAPYIPFGNLLPHISIMISNGGFGGTQNALAHGIPLIIAGATEDKMEVAARVEHAGVGINLRTDKASAKAIKQAVAKILSTPSYQQKAQALQIDYANYNAPELAVNWLEALIQKTA